MAGSTRALATSLDDFSLTITANYYLGLACLSAGDYAGAETYLRENVTLIEGDLVRERFGQFRSVEETCKCCGRESCTFMVEET